MTETLAARSRKTFLRDAALGSAALTGMGAIGALVPAAYADGHHHHKKGGVTKDDVQILIAAEIAEALAVTTYSNIINTAPFFAHLPDDDQGYIKAALQEEMSHYALEMGANPNLQDKDGDPPLTTAAQKGSEKLARILLEKGADPNLQNKNGGSPLIYAAGTGFTPVVRVLLEKGANPRLKDKKGRTALDWAKQQNHAEIVALLTARM